MVTDTKNEIKMFVPDGLTQKFKLTAIDRADCCDARAYYKVELKSSRLLYFCHHHYMKHKKALLLQTLRVRDESVQLTHNRHVGSSN